MDDFRFEDLRVKINPQSGADGIIIIEDTVAVSVDVAVIADTGGTILIVAGRSQPPPAVANVAFVSAIGNRMLGRLA